MENQKKNSTAKKLEWGDHNPKLTDENFIDRNHRKIRDQNDESTTINGESIDLSKEEPGRNRKGVREGEHK